MAFTVQEWMKIMSGVLDLKDASRADIVESLSLMGCQGMSVTPEEMLAAYDALHSTSASAAQDDAHLAGDLAADAAIWKDGDVPPPG